MRTRRFLFRFLMAATAWTLSLVPGPVFGADNIGECDPAEVKEQAETFARVDSAVHVYGETGTGKELLVQGLHNASRRKTGEVLGIGHSTLWRKLRAMADKAGVSK